MIKVIIIDDEPLARTLIIEYLQNFPGVEVIKECNDGFEGLKSIQDLKPDLIFLDIQMPRLNGFEMLELIENPPMIIFTTAFDEYALKAFESNALDYLLKPFSKDRFDKALNKIIDQKTKHSEKLESSLEHYPDSNNRIVVKTSSDIKIITVSDVLYIEAYDDYVKIFTANNCFIKKKTMTFYEKTLIDKAFVRIHRSYLLNIAYLTRIDQNDKEGYIAVLKNGTKLTLSRSGYGQLKNQLGI